MTPSGYLGCHTMRRPSLLSVLACLLAILTLFPVYSGCGDEEGQYSGVDLAGIRVFPREVIFSQIAIGESETQSVVVENTGGADLIISDYSWSGASGDFAIEGLDGLTIPVANAGNFNIIYEPTDEALDDAVLTINSNAGSATVTVSSLGQAALLRTDPAEIVLVSDAIGNAVAQDVRIFNAGTSSVELLGVSLVTGSPDFRMVGMGFELPVDLDVNGAVTVQIIYTPTGFGSDDANLLLEHDAGEGNTVVPVIGTLRTPQLTVEPEFVEFEAVLMDDTRVESATLTNTGQTTLEIYDVYMDHSSSDDFAIVSLAEQEYVPDSLEQVDVEPGESVTLELSYTPTDGGADAATAVIFSNDPEFGLFELPMGGRLDAPFLSVTPTTLGFGSVAGGLNRDLGVVVRNAGTGVLQLDDPVIETGTNFTLTNAHLYPDELASDEAFELSVRFSPNAEGNLTDVLVIASPNDPTNSPVNVTLNGFGAGEPYCELATIPDTVNFGMVPRGSRRVSRGAIRNIGPGNCLIRSVSLQPPPFGGLGPFGEIFSDAFSLEGVDPPAPLTLGPGEHFLIEAAYTPISFTAFSESLGDTGSVAVEAYDPVSGDEVECGSVALFSFAAVDRLCGLNLQARSGVASLAAIPSSVDFGLVTRGCNSQEVLVNLYNTGSAPVTITDIGLESCTAEFRLTGVPAEVSAGGLEVPSGSPPIPLRVRYTPAGLFSSSCDLVITSDAGGDTRLVVPLTGEGTNLSEQTDHFEQITGRKADVLFVVDNSGSMSEEQTNLADNFSDFIDAAETWGTDFQIAVITTEADDEYRGRLPGEFVGDPRILIPSTPSLNSRFTDNALVGDGGDGSREAGLDAAHLALSDPNISDVAVCDSDCVAPYACVPNADGSESRCGGYNRSFLRDDASLEIVFVSDEQDQSRGTVEFYVDFFQSIKGARNRALFHASAIVGPRGGCEGLGGSAEAGSDYLDVADATGGVSGSICDDNFSTHLANIGNRAFGLRVQFFLSRIADPATIEVTDPGGRDLTGWSFDELSNSIIFGEDSAPTPGQEFDVTYTARCF